MSAAMHVLNGLGRINHLVGRTGIVLGSVLIAIMTSVVIAGVFFRYVLNNSLSWAEDVSLIMMVTTAFLVAPFAYRSGANVAIEILAEMLPKVLMRVTRLIINALVLWLLYRFFLESLVLIERGWAIRVNTVPIPWAYPYMMVPVAFIAMAAVGIELLARDIYGIATQSDDADLPHQAPREPE
ncbi:MAG: TRAP transporter small permease subunit [Pseudomonadota bacterium]